MAKGRRAGGVGHHGWPSVPAWLPGMAGCRHGGERCSADTGTWGFGCNRPRSMHQRHDGGTGLAAIPFGVGLHHMENGSAPADQECCLVAGEVAL